MKCVLILLTDVKLFASREFKITTDFEEMHF